MECFTAEHWPYAVPGIVLLVVFVILSARLMRVGGEYAALPLLPFNEFLLAVRRDAALSLWPLMAGREAFPEYNTSRPIAGRVLRFVDAAEPAEG